MDTQQMQHFYEFCRDERAVGGPDPHMATMAEIVDRSHLTRTGRLWYAGCYVGLYNVPAALAVATSWGPEAIQADPDGFLRWIRTNWAGLPFRRERRAVRTPEKLARYFHSYAQWMLDVRPWQRTLPGGWDPVSRYEYAWKDVNTIYGIGRYSALKLLEYLTRYEGAQIENVGIHAAGGWSPVAGLALLLPDVPMKTANEAEDAAALVKMHLELEFGVSLDWYTLQVLLCDYKQAWTGQRQYPGRSLDSEIEYADKVADHFGSDLLGVFWGARAVLFPHAALGEITGRWPGVRKELGRFLRETGATWSDLRMQYP